MPVSKPLAVAHLQQARRNYRLYEKLKNEGVYLDWAVTVLFYTALRLTQAYIVEQAATGFDVPRSHDEREKAVLAKLPNVYQEYNFLQTRSIWARYHPDKPLPTLADLARYEQEWFSKIVTELDGKGIALIAGQP